MLGRNGVHGLRWSGGGERRQDLAVHVLGWLQSSFPVRLYFAPILPVRMVKHVEVQRSTWSVKFRFSIDRPHQRHVPCLRGTSCGVFVCMMRWHVHAARSLQYATSQCSKRSAPLCITQHAPYGTDTNLEVCRGLGEEQPPFCLTDGCSSPKSKHRGRRGDYQPTKTDAHPSMIMILKHLQGCPHPKSSQCVGCSAWKVRDRTQRA